jgi:protein TonB
MGRTLVWPFSFLKTNSGLHCDGVLRGNRSTLEDTMFADSLLDSHWGNRSRRGWTTLASFGLQAVAVVIVVSVPMLYTEGLPKLHLVSVGTPIGPPPGRRATTNQHPPTGHRPTKLRPNVFTAPPEIPQGVSHEPDLPPVEGTHDCPACVDGGFGTPGVNNPIIGSIGSAAPDVPPPPKPVARPPRASRIMEGNLIHKVQPVYPPMARAVRVQGTVVLKAIISKSGGIENLQVLSGHPMFVKAAIDAVSQWRYRPYILNDEPVEVETQITVNFLLSGG